MSKKIVCDGPDCAESMAEDSIFGGFNMSDYAWLTVHGHGADDKHFHSKACLAKWASQ